MTEHLQIYHLNVGKQKHTQWSMLNDESLARFAVLAVVEPYLYADPDTGEAQCGSHRYWRPLTPTVHREHEEVRYAYRSMLWISSAVQAVQIPVLSGDITAAMLCTAEGSILVFSAYDPNEGDELAERERMLLQKLSCIRHTIDETKRQRDEDVEIIICSDFNRHDPLWGGYDMVGRHRRYEGTPIVHLAHEYGLRSMLPAGTVTWEHHGKRQHSTIDVILASDGLAARLLRCQVHEHDHGSDHRAIALELDIQGPSQQAQQTRMLPEKANWSQIGRQIKRRLRTLPLSEPSTLESLDFVAEGFLAVVIDVVHRRVPRARPSPHSKRWWSTNLTLLRRSLSSTRNYVTTLRRRGVDTTEARISFQTIRKEYFREMEKQKKKHWKEFLEDPNNIWKANAFARTASQGTTIPTLHRETLTAESDEEKADMLMATFFPVPPEPMPGRGAAERRRKVGTGKVPEELPRVTEEEIRQAIYRSNPKKAPGADEISFEMWRRLLQYVGPWLRWIYQASLDLAYVPKSWRTAKIVALKKPGKSDYTVPKAYRPISLLPTISKGLEAIVATRLSYLAERYSLLPTNHFGGRKQRSCEQALDVLIEKILEAWRANKVLSLVTFDVQGAFNGVHPKVLEKRLRERSVPDSMVRWIRSFCEQRTGRVVVGNYTSPLSPIVHAGIPQGSPLSPILYVFYNANLVESKIGAEGGSLGFIDDYTAWRTGATRAETTRRLKVEVLRPAAQWAQEGGVTFEAEKTGLIHFERRPSEPGRPPVLRFLGRTIEPQDKVKVLGVILDSKLRMKLHIDKVVQAATKKCLAIRRLRGIRPKQMRQLYRAVIAPTVDYAASTWFARGRWGMQDHLTRLNRVQRLGAQAIIGAFRTVSTAVLQDEAGLEPVESRLAWRTARHTLDARSLPRTHPLWTIMNTMQARPDRHKSPLFQTWLRYNTTIQRTKAEGMAAKLAYVLPPWHDLQGILVVDSEAVACRFHPRVFSSIPKYPLLYTDASKRNGLIGYSVVLYNRKLYNPGYRVVRQETIGREKTCTVTTAEIWAIKEALMVFRESRSSGWIMTDSQEALRLVATGGKSSKSREAVLATLRELQNLRDAGLFAKILWIPGHRGVEGNERAHQAAQQMTIVGRTPTSDAARRVREHGMLSKLLRKAVEAEAPKTTPTWGRYTYTMDSALPGKHTLQLYGPLSREDSGILAQARTGHTHLNEYRARIKQADTALCDCNGGVESVKHVLLHCPMWTMERQRLREVAGDRWGDVSFLLGGKSRKCDPRTGKSVEGEKWKPETKVVRETIAFLKSTGRFSSQMQISNSS